MIDLLPSSLKVGKAGAESSDMPDPNALRRYSLSPLSINGRITPGSIRGLSPAPPPQSRRRVGGVQRFFETTWSRHKGPLLVAISQFFGATMTLVARILETGDGGLDPMQVLFARMSITTVVSLWYMWWQSVPNAPFGPREVWGLLAIRGIAGFFGIYGLWYSVMYLPLAEATVISFLAPNLAGYMCHMFLHEPFTRVEQAASFMSLFGIVLITRPMALFNGLSDGSTPNAAAAASVASGNGTATAPTGPDRDYIPTSNERLSAVGMALMGVVGGSMAITSLRAVGSRAHPLISVNYFSACCVIVTVLTLSVAPALDWNQPDLRFALPHNIKQWAMLFFIGISGFLTQFLLTAGLAAEKSNRATAMLYTAMLFAAGYDRWVFDHTMGPFSLAGCGIVLGGALWTALSKKEEKRGDYDVEARALTGQEAVPMLQSMDDDDAVPLEPIDR
jgi:drug/metabolite transporter (DMT)-like permease